jgi:hypothetical protein
MRALTQQLSALIVVGLCLAALIGAAERASTYAGQALRTLGQDSAGAAPLAIAASAAASLEALRPGLPANAARAR